MGRRREGGRGGGRGCSKRDWRGERKEEGRREIRGDHVHVHPHHMHVQYMYCLYSTVTLAFKHTFYTIRTHTRTHANKGTCMHTNETTVRQQSAHDTHSRQSSSSVHTFPSQLYILLEAPAGCQIQILHCWDDDLLKW